MLVRDRLEPPCPEDKLDDRQQDDGAQQRPQQSRNGKVARGEVDFTKVTCQQGAHDTHDDIDQQAASRQAFGPPRHECLIRF